MNGDDRAKTRNTPKVEISVRNFGPIAEADLDLRPLTVFVGPSNTGKTYLSVLIYALHGVFGGFSEFPLIHDVTTALKPQVNPTTLIEEIWDFLDKPNTEERGFKFSNLPARVRNFAQSSFQDPNRFSTELERCFDLDSIAELIQLTRGENNEMIISLKVNEASQNLWNFDMKAAKLEVTADGRINEETIVPKRFFEHFPWFSQLTEQQCYYLPAARSGIMQSHRVIASSLITRSTRAGIEHFAEVPTLSGVIADFMRHIILYEGYANPNDGMNNIANTLETDVLTGQIITKPSPTGYPEFRYRPQETERDMRLTHSSSMVSELAPLVLFIRDLVRPGDTLIIEEPEAHLHPAAQAEMAATLARLVRAGVRVLVTTHSDFMLQEIGNLMRVGMLKEKGALKKETNDWLLPEEVGAWHFQKDQPVKEIQFDHTVGIEPEDYEDVAESLYNRWAGLQNRIEELKDESERECE